MLDQKKIEELMSNPDLRGKVEEFLKEQVVDEFDIDAEKDPHNSYVLSSIYGLPNPGQVVDMWTGWNTVNARIVRVAKTGCIVAYADSYIFARYPNVESNLSAEEIKRLV